MMRRLGHSCLIQPVSSQVGVDKYDETGHAFFARLPLGLASSGSLAQAVGVQAT